MNTAPAAPLTRFAQVVAALERLGLLAPDATWEQFDRLMRTLEAESEEASS